MGATTFYNTQIGKFKDRFEAENDLRREMRERNGHQEGYSGDIQTCSRARLLHTHPRFGTKAFDKWEENILEELGKRECVVIELKGAALNKRKPNYLKGKRGVKGFYFFGWGAI